MRTRRSLDVPFRQMEYPDMSAADIIREIEALPLEEQLKVIAFSKELDLNREYTSVEFLAAARRYQDTADPAGVPALEDELVRAFYGPKGHA